MRQRIRKLQATLFESQIVSNDKAALSSKFYTCITVYVVCKYFTAPLILAANRGANPFSFCSNSFVERKAASRVILIFANGPSQKTLAGVKTRYPPAGDKNMWLSPLLSLSLHRNNTLYFPTKLKRCTSHFREHESCVVISCPMAPPTTPLRSIRACIKS